MDMNAYQDAATSTATYPDIGKNIIYPTLGLAGEAGETADKVKKVLRDDGGVLTETKRQAIAAEVGDCLWYVSQLARELGFTLAQIAEMNLTKLSSRKERNVLKGSGDNR
jgi:NTP pyrophosphatase (non-canonical NTP hydrolase)